MQRRPLTKFSVWAVTAMFLTSNIAGAVDLAQEPLVASAADPVKPNIFFIFDNSGSMNDEFMPDSVGSDDDNHCYRYSGYNKVYYNPDVIYPLPVTAAGADYPAASFSAAPTNGFNAASATTNLGTSFTTGENPENTVQVTMTGVRISSTNYAWQTRSGESGLWVRYNSNWYQRTQNNADAQRRWGVRIGSTWYYERTWQEEQETGEYKYPSTAYYARYIGATPDNPGCLDSSYQIVQVTAASAEAQNFANWYSYYRNRLLTMKSSAGLAFQNLDDKYRVGFTVISSTGTNSSGFLGNKTFSGDHRDDWYEMLYAAYGTGYTPLRGALSKAGRYYAGTLVTGNGDPVQYACQRNYTILTTDGLWNTNAETTTYRANRENNSTQVGDQDDAADRPYRDGDGTHSNTLADVAMYYYNTDLRTGAGQGGLTDENNRISVSNNIVPTSPSDSASHQHMVTFTLGLGVDGTLPFSAATLAQITQGTLQWPDPISNSGAERIDDLWHAAVNGRGSYFSAKDPAQIVTGLSSVLASIKATTGSSSAAATSTLQPVQGDNLAFIAKFTTVEWTGDLLAHRINLGTGALEADPIWSAQAKLETQVGASTDTRAIYTFNSAADDLDKLKEFTAGNLAAEIGSGWFNPSQLSQYASYTTDQAPNATAAAMISYLRGHGANENTGDSLATDLFRDRTIELEGGTTQRRVLGDIVNAAPVYASKPPFAYIGAEDVGYLTFAASNANRPATVYVGGNDGMLHAFDASVDADGAPTLTSGKERWAYIPSAVLPNLHRLADHEYGQEGGHRYFVDGPLTIGDVYDTTALQWRTILVGGLGAGGRSYYALDITDPLNPEALWEFGTAQDADLGYTYGNPVITKRNTDGRWVVAFSSGYDNVSPGDGRGRLFVVDAVTGAKLSEIVAPSAGFYSGENLTGIGRVSNFVNNVKDNRTQYVYGGDLSGSLWRFDLDGASAIRLARTKAELGAQPITVQPEMAEIDGHRVVIFGTGRFLGQSDVSVHVSASRQQAVYAVKDTGAYLATIGEGAGNLVALTLNAGTDPRTSSSVTPVNWASHNGWHVQVPLTERFTVDPSLQLGVVNIAANIPLVNNDRCNPKGSSVLYQLSYRSGTVLNSEVYQAQIVGNTAIQLPSGNTVNILVMADGTTQPQPDPPGIPGPGGVTRTSWRELD